MIAGVAGKVTGITKSSGANCRTAKRRRRTLNAFRTAFVDSVASEAGRIELVITIVACEIAFLTAVTEGTAVCRSRAWNTIAAAGTDTVIRQTVITALMILRIADEIADKVFRTKLLANWRTIGIDIRTVHAVLTAAIYCRILYTHTIFFVIALITLEIAGYPVACLFSVADVRTG